MVNERWTSIEGNFITDGDFRNIAIVPKRVSPRIYNPVESWKLTEEDSPLNVRFTRQGVLWPALDGGKPFYIPPGIGITYSPWLMHRRVDLWGPTGRLPPNSSVELVP